MCLVKSELLADVDSVSSMSEKVRMISLKKVAELCKHMALQSSEGRCRRRGGKSLAPVLLIGSCVGPGFGRG